MPLGRGKKMSIFDKIKIIAELRKENRELKETIETLERKVESLERAVVWSRVFPGGLGGHRR
jgi:predicted RNase H-like nuclease (RuvC/YqgF family)